MNLVIPMLLLAAVAPASTRGARPASCASGLGQSGYDAGYEGQSKVLADLWSEYHESCDELNRFKNNVVLALTRDPPDDVFLRCRRAGMLQAFDDAIARITSTCKSTCALELEAYTKISAQIFCDGTAAAGFAHELYKRGVATPNCGSNDWATCKQKVKTEATTACPDKVAARSGELDSLTAAACQSPQ